MMQEPPHILILCTGNSCRSQMAEAFLRAMDSSLPVFSAGTYPSEEVHPLAIRVMQEKGIDLSTHFPKSIQRFLPVPFDYVITVCHHAKEHCPVFPGTHTKHLHYDFPDPAALTGPEEIRLAGFREIRDTIQEKCREFYQSHILPSL